MLKIRVIPVLTFNGMALVKTKGFTNPRMVGNPMQAARIYNSRGVDELVFVDITASKEGRLLDVGLLKNVLKECMIPLGVGGGIKTIDDIQLILKAGADKVVIKTKAIEDAAFVRQAANVFGSQAITISIDAKRNAGGRWDVWHPTLGSQPLDSFIKKMEDAGAGEFFLCSIDEDGMMNGFDKALVKFVHEKTSLPIIACGGAGEPRHFCELLEEVPIEAVAAASIFHFTQYTPGDVKTALREMGKPVRLNS